MEIFKINKLRVNTISVITSKGVKKRPIEEGLAIEYEYQPSSYLVIAFVEYDEKEDEYEYRTVVNRVENYLETKGDIRDFRTCLDRCLEEFRKVYEEEYGNRYE